MKKIYLLLIFCCICFAGSAKKYYSDSAGPGAHLNVLANWDTSIMGGPSTHPIDFTSATDTFYVTQPCQMPTFGVWSVAGTVIDTLNGQITKGDTGTAALIISGSLVMYGTTTITSGLAASGRFDVAVLGDVFILDHSRIHPALQTHPISFNFSDFSIYPARKYVTWTSDSMSRYTNIAFDNGCVRELLSDIWQPRLSGLTDKLAGTLICDNHFIRSDSLDTFTIYHDASIYTTNVGGIDSSIKQMANIHFSGGAHYIYNGTTTQVTGTTMPTTFVLPGSVTVDNTAGVGMSPQLTTFDTGSSVNLEAGTFVQGGNVVFNPGSNVNVDNGGFDGPPHYNAFTTYGVNVAYKNLGVNALSFTTGYELTPTLLTNSIGKVIVDKPFATITLNSGFTANDSVILDTGTLDASSTYYVATAKSSWSNFASAGAFIPRIGSVIFSGTALQNIGGTYSTTFNDFVVSNNAGVTIADTEFVDGTMSFVNGAVTLGGNEFVFGPSANPVVGAGGSKYILDYTTGHVEKQFTGTGSFTYPVGDATHYTPITLNVSGGTFGAGAEASVTLQAIKEIHNANTTAYLNRFWQVIVSNITSPVYAATSASYVPGAYPGVGDVTGLEANMSMGVYTGALPWQRFDAAITGSHTLVMTTGTVSSDTANFTGISTANPTITGAAGVRMCRPRVDTVTLTATAPSGDPITTYTWAPSASLSASTGLSVLAFPTTTTTYTVTITDGNGFTGTATTLVQVDSTPSLSVGVVTSSPVCVGDNLILTAAGPVSVTTFVWSGPVAISSGDSTAVATVNNVTTAAAGTYTVTLTNGTDTGCSATYSNVLPVEIDTLPSATVASGAGTFCASTIITATTPGAGTVYFQDTVRGGTSVFKGLSPQTVTASGTYYFRAKNAAGCWGPEDSVKVIINPLPTLYTLTGGGNYCKGTTGDTVGLSGSDTGISYLLYYNGVPTTDSIAGTGLSINYGTFYLGGNYTVTGTNRITGCNTDMGTTATIIIDSLPTEWSMTGAGGYCSGSGGSDIGLNWSDAGTSYQLWFKDTTIGSAYITSGVALSGVIAPLDFGNQTAVGTYMVIATSSAGCIDTMVDADTNAVFVYPNPNQYTVSGGGTDCADGIGFDIILNNSDVTTSYQLYGAVTGVVGVPVFGTGDTLHFGFQNTTDTYVATATNSVGCTDTMFGSANIIANPLPTAYSISSGGAYCVGDTIPYDISLSNSDVGISYELLLNGIHDSTMAGTGSPLDFGFFTDAGTYTITATNLTTGCINTAAGGTTPATITVNPLPNVYSLSGGGAYCAGGTGVDMQLSGSDAAPVIYLLYIGGAYSGISVPGTGAVPFDLGNQTLPGMFTVVASNGSTGCNIQMIDSARVIVDSLPRVYNVIGGGSFCGIDTVLYHVGLDYSQTGKSYKLYKDGDSTGQPVRAGTGGALDFGTPHITGFYTVVATDDITGCTNNMNGGVSFVSYGRPAIFSVSGGGAYCAGGAGVPVNISGTESHVTYQLYDTTLIPGATLAGTGSGGTFGNQFRNGLYTVIATNDSSGCGSYMTGSAFVVVNPLPTTFTIAGGGAYCAGDTGVHLLLAASTVGITYQLYRGTSTVGAPLAGTGFGLDYGLFNTVGTYSIVGTNVVTGCQSNMAGTETISINALPTVYNVTGGGTICAGAAGDTVFLSGSQTGIGYQLYNSGATVGLPAGGTGSAFNYGPITTAGHYSVVARNLSTGCHSNMLDTVTINVNPLPNVYDITGGGRYCLGDSGVYVGLSGSDTSNIHYQLYLGALGTGGPKPGVSGPINFGRVPGVGTYYVLATNMTTGCVQTMHGTVSVNTNPLPPTHLVFGGGVYCAGDTGVHVGLNGSNLGIAYQLYDGHATSGLPKKGNGTALDFGLKTDDSVYTVIATDTTTGCTNTMTGSVTVSTQPYLVPVVTLTATQGTVINVGQEDTVIATVSGAGVGTPTYQWLLNNNVVPGATNSTFVFSIYFNYDSIVCQVTSSGMCGGVTTSKLIVIMINDVAVKQIIPNNSDIKLIPNPNKGVFNLKGTLGTIDDQEVNVEVTNMLGQVVYKNKMMSVNGVVDEHIELGGNLANGMYLLNLRSGNINNVFHFVVEQ